MAGEQQVGHDDGAGIDEGIARDALFVFSRPTRCHRASPILPSASVTANTLEMLWIENGSSASPVEKVSPLTVATEMPNLRGSTAASLGM
jgi:hypothetical protein